MFVVIPSSRKWVLAFGLLLAGALAQTQAAAPPQPWSGDVPNGTVWGRQAVVLLTGNTRVPPGATLTIEAGTVVKASGSISLTIEGVLVAHGTAAEPIVITDLRDDTAGDDTNNNGPSVGYPGAWGQIRFAATSAGSALEHVDVRFGGAGVSAAVLVEGSQVSFTQCSVRLSSVDGLRVVGSRPVISQGTFQGNWGSALSMDLAANPAITGVIVGTNGINGLSVDSGVLPADGFWDDPDAVYYLKGSVTVPAGRRLTIAAGQVIKCWGATSLLVQGTVEAKGTTGRPVVFTDLRDDSAGGDTNNNGPSVGYNGDWGRVEFAPGSVGNELSAVEFRYGGLGATAQVVVHGAQVRFGGCTVRHSRSAGLRIVESNPIVAGGSFHDNWGSALSMDLASNPALTGVTLAANGVNAMSVDGGVLGQDGFWDDPDVVYHLQANVAVPAGRQLTIGPGQIIKSWGATSLLVQGTLRAAGNAAHPIVFSELRDDSAGGDTDNNGPSVGYNGNWARLEFAPGSAGNELTGVEFRYGGLGSSAQVVVNSAEVRFTRCIVRHSRIDGLRILNSNPVIVEGTFHDNWGSAISMDLASDPVVTEATVRANALNGLSVDAGTLPVDGSWDDPSVVYQLRGNVTVPAGRRLTLAAGQVIKSSGTTSLVVEGTLHAAGTVAHPVVFTELQDDSAGGDTNNNGPSTGYNGNWGRLEFAPTSTDNVLEWVEVRYGGGGAAGQVVINGAQARLTDCTFRHSRIDGVRILGCSPVIARGTFHDNWGSALSMDLASDPVVTTPNLRANQVNGLSLDAGALPADGVWDDPDVVYHLKGHIVVPAGRSLRLAPGQVVKSAGSTSLLIQGTLLAHGTPQRPIVFTELRDDALGGDTNNDGRSTGYYGNWGRIEFLASSQDHDVAHLQAHFAGASSPGALVVSGPPLHLDACQVRMSATHGVVANAGARLQLHASVISQNLGSGLRAESGAQVDAINNTIDANDRGVWADAATVLLVNNLVTSNRRTGLTREPTAVVTARNSNVHNPAAGTRNYDGLPALTGTDGNLDLDPQYVDVDHQNYALKPTSPMIDAGLGDVAPELDFLGQVRVDDPLHPNTGSGSPPYVDLGAFELDRWLSQLDTPNRPGQIVAGDTLRFAGTAKALDGPTRFRWDFGGGQASDLEDPGLVTFRTAGTRTITFTAVAPDGAADPNPASLVLTVVADTGPLPDLEITQIETPGGLGVGQPIEVRYHVRNRGNADLAGRTWSDALYLSSDAFLDSADVRMDRREVSRLLATGSEYTETFHATLNAAQLQTGVLHLIVSVDDDWALLEQRQMNNEKGLPVDLAVPELQSGVPQSARFAGAGAGHYFRLTVAAGQNLRVWLDDANDAGINELYLRRGALPTREVFDARFDLPSSADQELLVGAPAPGVWYVLAFGGRVPDTGEYAIQADAAPIQISRAFPDRFGQVNGALLRLRGAGFVPGTTVELVGSGGTRYSAATVTVDSFTQLSAALDLAALNPGAYGIRVQAGEAVDQLDGALTVVAGGQARLETHLVVPGVVGYHQLATLYIEYRNTGNAAMPAPLLSLSATQGGNQHALLTLDAARVTQGLWVAGLPEGFSHSLHVLASGEIPGWLHPGESGRIPVYYAGWLQPWDLTYPPIEFDLLATTTESTIPIDWPTLKATLRPGSVRPDAWELLAGNLEAEVGPTWGSLMTVLNEQAAYLGQLGQRVSDVVSLLGFKLAQADGAFPFTRLDREIDVLNEAAGPPLVFERSYPALISARFELGALGRGWTHCWETSLRSSPDGSVALRLRGSGVRIFQPDLRGGYLPPPGDNGRLSKLPDARFRLQDEDGVTSLFRADGRLESLQDANGRQLTCEYTGSQLTRLRHSTGPELRFEYNPAGRLARVLDAQGQVVTYTYDAAQEHLVGVSYPDGRSITYRYGSGGRVTHALLEKQDTRGDALVFAHDAQGRVESVTLNGAASPAVKLDYGTAGAVSISSGQAAGAFFFDTRGRLVKTRDADGMTHQALYDPRGKLVELIDPFGRTTRCSYDPHGNLQTVTDPLGRTTGFAYDAQARLTAITDPRGQTTDYGHDPRGNLVEVAYPDATTDQYVYDSAGQLSHWVQPGGARIGFTYDTAGRLTRVAADDGSEFVYGYDARGRVTTAQDRAGTTTFTYNTSNQVTHVEFPSGRFLEFAYDTSGRRQSMADQAGFTVRYEYDAAGRLQQLMNAQNQVLVSYRYDAAGRVERVERANGTRSTYAYNPAGRLTSIVNADPSGQPLSSFTWTRDEAARIATLDLLEGRWTYSYDVLGQLVRARFVSGVPNVPDQDLVFEYDAAGNRTRTVARGAATDYSANPLNQYSKAGAASFDYDARGNLTVRTEGVQTWQYHYDAFGRLDQADTPDGTWRYEYDALGNRIATIHGTERQEFVYDPFGLNAIVGEYGGDGSLVAHYTQGIGLVSRTDPSGALHFYEFDPMGSTSGMTDATGARVNQYLYEPFGGLLLAEETVPNPFKFVGRSGVTRDGSGLDHMRARDYLAGLGRFLSRDPLGQSAGLNLYTYAANNPLSFIDPRGEYENAFDVGVFYDGGGQNQVMSIVQMAYDAGWKRYLQAMSEAGFTTEDQQATLDRGQQSLDAVLLLQSAIGWIKDTKETIFFEVRDFSGARFSELCSGVDSISGWLGETWTGLQRDARDWYNQELPKNIELLTQWFSAMIPQVRGQAGQAFQWIGNQWQSLVAGSIDPNQKLGPGGGGPGHHVPADALLSYRIDFENDAQASSPAQYISIVDDLHPNLDWSTFELTEIAFGDHSITLAEGTRALATHEPITSLGQELTVEITAALDLDSGRFQVVLSTLVPATGLPPDVTRGFLPPEDGTGRGQGHICYRIRPKAGLPSGTEIFNIARITFDFAETIATDQVDPHDPGKGIDPARQARNTLDAAAPVSQVKPLPEVSSRTQFLVEWEAADEPNGSGVAGVDLFVAVDRGPWTRWKELALGNQALYSGEPGRRYAFYSVAHDLAGHAEAAPATADTTTEVPALTGVKLGLQSEPAGGTTTLSWPTLVGRSYTLLHAPAPEGPWDPVPAVSNQPGTGDPMTYEATTAGPAGFFQLEIK